MNIWNNFLEFKKIYSSISYCVKLSNASKQVIVSIEIRIHSRKWMETFLEKSEVLLEMRSDSLVGVV